MTETNTFDPSDHISVDDMSKMFSDEISNVTKAAELRIREFATFMKEYAAGEITPEQAMDKISRHQDKWGEAVPGVYSVAGKSDDELLAAVDKHAGPLKTRAESERRYQDAVGRSSGQSRIDRS